MRVPIRPAETTSLDKWCLRQSNSWAKSEKRTGSIRLRDWTLPKDDLMCFSFWSVSSFDVRISFRIFSVVLCVFFAFAFCFIHGKFHRDGIETISRKFNMRHENFFREFRYFLLYRPLFGPHCLIYEYIRNKEIYLNKSWRLRSWNCVAPRIYCREKFRC